MDSGTYLQELLAANKERRDAVQAATQVRLALANEQQRHTALIRRYSVETAKAVGLQAELRELKAENVRLQILLKTGPPDRPAAMRPVLTPASLEKRGSTALGEDPAGPHKRSRLRAEPSRRTTPVARTTFDLTQTPPHATPTPVGHATSRTTVTESVMSESLTPTSFTNRSISPSPGLTHGVYIFVGNPNMPKIIEIPIKKVPTAVLGAVLEIVNSAGTPETVRKVFKGTCIRQHKRGMATDNYFDDFTGTFIPEVACKDCTFSCHLCVRRAGGSSYDVILAPLAKEFRESATEDSIDWYITRTQLIRPRTNLFGKTARGKISDVL